MTSHRRHEDADDASDLDAASLDDTSYDAILREIASAPARPPSPEVDIAPRGEGQHRYLVQRRLGRGGMGAVYLALDSVLERQVAIKVIESSRALDPSRARATLLEEARIAATIEHERIARVYDVSEHDGVTFVVMEYVRGTSVRNWMRSTHSPTATSEIILGIAEGLRALHDGGVVHGDLKPENVMLAANGGLKLVDFGLAARPLAARAGREWTARGTPSYMAPEQCDGAPKGARSDIFALGVVIAELITSRRPSSLPRERTSRAQATPRHARLLEHRAWRLFPPGLPALVAAMLAEDPSARPADGAVVARELSRIFARALGTGTGPESAARAVDRSDPMLSTLALKVTRYWMENVLAKIERTGLVSQEISFQPNLVDGHRARTLGALHDATPEGIEAPSSPGDVFEDAERSLLVVGDAGCGKTLYLLRILRHLLDAPGLADRDVPVIISLSTWEGGPFEDFIVRELGCIYQVPPSLASAWVRESRLVLLLDGLDEVARTARNDCVDAINSWVATHRPLGIAVTMRSEAGRVLTRPLALNKAICLAQFTDRQVDAFVEAQDRATSEALHRIFREDARLREVARTPLLLNLMAHRREGLLTRDDAAAGIDVAARVCELYARAIIRQRASTEGSGIEALHRHLSWVARAMISENRAVFLVEDIQPRALETFAGRLAYSVVTRAFVASVFAMSVVPALGYSPLENDGFRLTVPIAMRIAEVGAISTACTYALLALARLAEPTSRPLRPLLRSLSSTLGSFVVALLTGGLMALGLRGYHHPSVTWMSFEYCLLASIFAGFGRPRDGRDILLRRRQRWALAPLRRRWHLVVVAGFIAFATTFVLHNGWLAAATICFVVTTGAVAVGGLEDELREAEDGNEGTLANVRAAAMAFGLVFILTMVAFGVSYGFAYGALVGLCLGCLVALRFGAMDVVHHYALRLLVAPDSGIDFDIVGSLNVAAEAGLARRFGSKYAFTHRLLLEYFAARTR